MLTSTAATASPSVAETVQFIRSHLTRIDRERAYWLGLLSLYTQTGAISHPEEEPTVSRSNRAGIVVAPEKRVKLILRKKLDDGTAATVADYIKIGQNGPDAINFSFLPATATVADGRRLLTLFNTLDIFVTDHGMTGEPVTGWVTDDKLT